MTIAGRIEDDQDGRVLVSDALEQLLDELVVEMEKLTDIEDPEVEATLHDGTVTLSVDVVGDPSSPEDALALGRSRIRSALHSAMIATPGWEAIADARLEHQRGSIQADQFSVRRQLVDA